MKRIIIVDDSLELGRVLQALIASLDPSLSITVVPSAEEALLASSRNPLDLLVTDIRLAGMTGFDLVKKIRTRSPETKILIITGMIDEKYSRQARELKVDGFFQKPLALPEFQAAIVNCLNLKVIREAPPVFAPPPPAAEVQTGLEPSGRGEGIERLPDILTNLRHSLGAFAVVLLDNRGQIVAQAGELPEAAFDRDWIPPIMVAASANSKVVNLVGGPLAENAQAFRGKTFDLVLVGIGDYSVVIILRSGKSALRLALAFEEAYNVQQDLAVVLGNHMTQNNLGLGKSGPRFSHAPVTPAPGPQPEAFPADQPVEPGVEDLAALLEKSIQNINKAEANAFWDTLSGPKPAPTRNPDELSYEQATRLGLAPPDPS